MNIIACSYTNIGPFANHTISLVIHPGAAMIVAPVGTGKSMLFFDAIIYGLYKYSTRDIVNVSCHSGSIALLVELHGDYWVIHRELKATKARNISTVSSIARWYGSIEELYRTYGDIVYHKKDIVGELSASCESIIFKNESDLQKHWEMFLPPRDVFMNRDMMMQESANIFDLTQSERISVFKHLFNLLDIDVAKERISDEKLRLKYLLQARKDMSPLVTKFGHVIDGLMMSLETITQETIIDINHYGGDQIRQRLSQSRVLGTTVSLEQVSLIDRDEIHTIRTLLESYKQEYHQFHAQLTQLARQKSQLEKQIGDIMSQITLDKKELEEYNSLISTYNQQQLTALKSDKLHLIQNMNDLEFSIDYDSFDIVVEDLQQAYDYVVILTQKGKELSLRHAHLLDQIKGVEDMQQLQLSNQQSQIISLEKQISQIVAQIVTKEEKITIATKFYCTKIDAECPFIEQISGGVVAAHERELEQLRGQHQSLIKNLEEIHGLSKKVDYKEHLTRLIAEKHALESELQELRSRLVVVGYKKIMDLYPQYQQYQSKLKLVDHQIAQYEDQLQQLDSIVTQKALLEATILHKQSELSKLRSDQDIFMVQFDDLNSAVAQYTDRHQRTMGYEKQLHLMVDYIARANEIITDYKLHQQETLALEYRAKKVDELHAIVSKELTVLVLQEYLPLLSDMINNQLAKVVDYRLSVTVNAGGDKLEIMIVDQYGSREVKSLSGGQRAILRLCWILAIALWSGNKFLFLDETINHLDKAMVSKAAELIEEFVQGNKVTLYAITHSEQIQEMDIWDYVVRINSSAG